MFNYMKKSLGMPETSPPKMPSYAMPTFSPSFDTLEEAPSTPKKRKRKEPTSKSPKEYIPQSRSGGWSILVSMLENSENPLDAVYTKSEIQHNASKWSRTPMKLVYVQGKPVTPHW
jgi:hypothetical protein